MQLGGRIHRDQHIDEPWHSEGELMDNEVHFFSNEVQNKLWQFPREMRSATNAITKEEIFHPKDTLMQLGLAESESTLFGQKSNVAQVSDSIIMIPNCCCTGLFKGKLRPSRSVCADQCIMYATSLKPIAVLLSLNRSVAIR